MLLVGTFAIVAATSPPTMPGFHVQHGNACGIECGCSGSSCKDKPGELHFAGTMGSLAECEKSCTDAPKDACNIFIYSLTSHHCWWRLDGEWSPDTNSGVVSGCRQDTAACIPGCGSCTKPKPTPPPAPPFVPSTAPNMNGEYYLSPTPGGPDAQEKHPTNFKDYPGGVEYFDWYSPNITQLYSQVFWTGTAPVALPEEIVKRYAGRGMAVVGFEANQVRRTPHGDVPVPIDVVYNHHFESTMIGTKAALERIEFEGPDDPRFHELDAEARKSGMGHGISSHVHYRVHDLRKEKSQTLPSHVAFGAANGGEYRKSFHGFPAGYVQVIESPTHFQLTPMQIDTWHRDKMSLVGPTKFVAGPLPRNSLAGPDAAYSGLLECPFTTRLSREIDSPDLSVVSGQCPPHSPKFSNGTDCLAAAKALFGRSKQPFELAPGVGKLAGCAASSSPDGKTIRVTFNPGSGEECGSPKGTAVVGSTTSLVSTTVHLSEDIATITLEGPATVWYGVGFNAQVMKDAPWAIIVDGHGGVTERKLADQSPGTLLNSSVTVVSNTVSGANRTVVMTRPFKGLTKDHFTFDPASDTVLPLINAVGSGPVLAFHKAKAPTALTLLPALQGGTCVCHAAPKPFGQGSGRFVYHQTNQTADVGQGVIGFPNKCAPYPRSDLLWQKNPICDPRTYVGGQTACHHMFSLLDADQEIPWVDRPLEYNMKFRFWVQPYNKSVHQRVERVTWGIASPVEYDVPKCGPDVPKCTKAADGSWIHTITGTWDSGGKVLAAHFHCHAPTCLEMTMYKCPKGTRVCNATTGSVLCSEKPIYGGTGKVKSPDADEPGYILQPPCLWGNPKYGLEPPVDVGNYTLGTVKHSNATWGHHGEMAWQQMFLLLE